MWDSIVKDVLCRKRRNPAQPSSTNRFAAKTCEKLQDFDWVDLQDNQFRLDRPGENSAIVTDARASDGKAARMPGSHLEWSVSCPISDDFAPFGPWHCYAMVRCEAKAKDGPAMEIGIYDGLNRRTVTSRRPAVSETVGPEYRVIDLGIHALTGDMYFWFAPPKRPGEVDTVFIDRIFLIRAPKAAEPKP